MRGYLGSFLGGIADTVAIPYARADDGDDEDEENEDEDEEEKPDKEDEEEEEEEEPLWVRPDRWKFVKGVCGDAELAGTVRLSASKE